jgi:hypothetical protein
MRSELNAESLPPGESPTAVAGSAHGRIERKQREVKSHWAVPSVLVTSLLRRPKNDRRLQHCVCFYGFGIDG